MIKSKFSADDKLKLNAAFRELRKRGYIARQNYQCCQSCAGSFIAHDIRHMTLPERAKVRGCVFYHKQDGDRLKHNGEFMLRYGPVEVEGLGTIGLDAFTVGCDVCRILETYGLEYEWNQKPNSAILVKGSKR